MGTLCSVEKSESGHVIVHRQSSLSQEQDKEEVVNVHVTVLKTVNIQISPSSEPQHRAEVTGNREKGTGDSSDVVRYQTKTLDNSEDSVSSDRTKVKGDRSEVKAIANTEEVVENRRKSEVTMATGPLRTVSVIQQEEKDKLIRNHPELSETLAKIKSLGKDKFFTTKADHGDYDESDLKDLFECLKDTLLPYWKDFSKPDQRKLIGNTMADTGLLDDMLDCYIILADGTEPNLKEECFEAYILMDIRKLLWNFSDLSEPMRNAIAQRKDFLSILAMDLRDLSSSEKLLNTVNKDNFRFTSAVGILNNCSRGDTEKSEYVVKIVDKEKHLIHVLFPFTDHGDEYVKLVTLLVLSRLVEEKNNKLLEAKVYLFEFLLKKIQEAMKSEDKRWQGFSVDELVDGLAHLAKNDKNKTTIMEKGAFGILKEILTTSSSDDEKLAAVRAIWELSYEEKYKDIFKGDEEIRQTLTELSSSPVKALHESAKWTCFEIGITPGKEVKNEEKETVKEEIEVHESVETKKKTGHIMLSYNWGSQAVVVKICDRLISEGFKVWMDIHDIRRKGDLLDAMSDAVENSSVVLICYSEKYKNSKNCRTEAKYAYDLLDKLDIIALKMQKGYKPDGWLGAMIAGLVYYDLTHEKTFESTLQDLISSLREKLGRQESNGSNATITVKPTEIAKKADIMQWQEAEVTKWLKSNDLYKFYGRGDTPLTGEQLVFLCELYKRAPEFFYRCLKDELHLRGLEELKQFNNAIRSLFKEYPDLHAICS